MPSWAHLVSAKSNNTFSHSFAGCGKTTLLDILAGRRIGGGISGDILVNGAQRDLHSFRQISAYVMQDDLLYSFLTVKEILLFTADLKISKSTSKAEKLQRVCSSLSSPTLRNRWKE